MTTPVGLCNIALGMVGGGTISAIDSSTPAGIACGVFYDPAVSAVLQEHPWKAALRKIELAFVDDLTPEWRDATSGDPVSRAFVLPNGKGKHGYCERVWRLNDNAIVHHPEQRTVQVGDSDATVDDNLLASPYDLSATDWTASGTGSVTANNAAAPDGTKTADLLTDADAAARYYLAQSATLDDDDGLYVADVWVKAGTATRATLEVSLSGGTATVATLELTFSGETLAVTCDQPGLLHSWGVDIASAAASYHLFLAVRNDANSACEVRLYPSGKINGAVGDITTCNFWNAKLRLVTPVQAQCVLRPATSGGGIDCAGFPALLVRAIATLLASDLAPKFGNLYGNSDAWYQRYERSALPKARGASAQEGTPEELEITDFLDSRN